MAQSKRQENNEFSSFEGGSQGAEGEGDDSAEVEYEAGEGMLVDLSDTSDTITYPVHPRGIYDAEIFSMEYGQSQRSGNNMWTVVWELTDPKLAVNDKQPRQWLHLTFDGGGLPRVKRFLANIKTHDGFNLHLLKGKFDPEKIADEGKLLGAKARLRLDIRRYQGQNRNNVRDVLPPAGAAGGTGFANL
jgi:hypothetical protein